MLKGLLHCLPCGCSLTPAHCEENGTIRYCCYLYMNAREHSWNLSCRNRSSLENQTLRPSGSQIPAMDGESGSPHELPDLERAVPSLGREQFSVAADELRVLNALVPRKR